MRKILVTLIVLMCLLVPTAVAQAATDASVTVYATPSYMSIDVRHAGGTSYNFGGPTGGIVAGETYWTSTNTTTAPDFPLHTSNCSFKVSNNSSINIAITITSTNWTSGGDDWFVSQTNPPSAGENIFALYAGAEGTASEGDMVPVRFSVPWVLHTTSSAGDAFAFEMKLVAPTAFTDAVQKSGSITLSASSS